MIDKEARIEVLVQNLVAIVGHLPAAGRAGGDGVQHGAGVKACLLGVGDGLAAAGQGAGQGDLVGHLAVLAHAGAAFVDDVGAHGGKDILLGIEDLFVSAHHDGQGSLLGADVSAGDRRVKGKDAPLFRGFVNPDGKLGAGGGHVDDGGAHRNVRDDAVLSEIDLFHILREAHDGDHHVLSLSALLHGVAPDCAFPDHILHLTLGSCIDGNLKAFLSQVSHHGFSHDANAYKADFLHSFCCLLRCSFVLSGKVQSRGLILSGLPSFVSGDAHWL